MEFTNNDPVDNVLIDIDREDNPKTDNPLESKSHIVPEDINEEEKGDEKRFQSERIGIIRNKRAQSLGYHRRSRPFKPTLDMEGRRHSTFCEMLSTASNEESRITEEKAAELESRLKNLVSAFSIRVKKKKEEIRRPPTPSSEESDSDISEVSQANLNERLKVFSPAPSEPSRQISPTFSIISIRILRGILKGLYKILRLLRCDYILDPQNKMYIFWLIWVSMWFMYNAWVIPLRGIFPYQTNKNLPVWIILDSVADLIYLIDMIAFKSHTKFILHGFWVKQSKETFKFYFFSRKFVIDIISLLPLDWVSTFYYTNIPWLRLPRLLKITTFWELFQILDSVLSSPHSARIARTLIYMLYMIHLNASAYYALSRWEGIGQTGWTFNGEGNAYVRCYYFATKTATSIGKNPKPDNEIEYIFMTCAWLSGVFVFAILIGQIRDIVATATKAQTEYRQVCYATDSYLQRFDIPSSLQHKVKSWLSYTWEQQKTLDESKILAQLPQKMQADIALHVHIDTLSKVKLFQNCEVAFLRDLVVKLRSIIFLPGDFVCRKGEVGKEMYIVKTGKIFVVGGPNGSDILATLKEGAVFGEIALLAIGGVNKRTADVRSGGFANLFVLSKEDLNDAIKDYPLAQESMRKKAKKIVREQSKKAKEQLEEKLEAVYSTGGSHSSLESDIRIIKDKTPQPKILNILLKAMPKNSMTAKYIKYGSKASSTMSINPTLSSYPPSPFLPVDNLGDATPSSFSYESSDSSDVNFQNPSYRDGITNFKNAEMNKTSDFQTANSSISKLDPNSETYSRIGIMLQQRSSTNSLSSRSTSDSSSPNVADANSFINLQIASSHPLQDVDVKLEKVELYRSPKKVVVENMGVPLISISISDKDLKDEDNVEKEKNVAGFDEGNDLPSMEQTASVLAFSSRWKKRSSGLKRQFSLDDNVLDETGNDNNDGG